MRDVRDASCAFVSDLSRLSMIVGGILECGLFNHLVLLLHSSERATTSFHLLQCNAIFVGSTL